VRGPIKRKAGRPKGTRKLPSEYYDDLLRLFDSWRGPKSEGNALVWRNPNLSKNCHIIARQGGVEWKDRRTGQITRITNANVLRTRIIEARNWAMRPVKVTSTISTAPASYAPDFKSPIVDFQVIFVNSTSVRSQRETILRVGKKFMPHQPPVTCLADALPRK
jgi:hypothetical protein